MLYTENASLIRRHQAGDRAATEELLALNAGLIAGIARRYLHRAGCLELPDLMQEARLALLYAADRFDGKRGTQFSTFATAHIHRAIQRAIAGTGNLVRLPDHVLARLRHAAATGTGEGWLAQIPQQFVSLDMAVADDGTERLVDRLPSGEDVEGDVIGRDWIAGLMGSLTTRERNVIQRRHGWHGRPETLGQVAEHLRLTREGVRQIELRAIRKLRGKVGCM